MPSPGDGDHSERTHACTSQPSRHLFSFCGDVLQSFLDSGCDQRQPARPCPFRQRVEPRCARCSPQTLPASAPRAAPAGPPAVTWISLHMTSFPRRIPGAAPSFQLSCSPSAGPGPAASTHGLPETRTLGQPQAGWTGNAGVAAHAWSASCWATPSQRNSHPFLQAKHCL